ncbi:hypothetical protein ES707_14540 [subsurface metagenome]
MKKIYFLATLAFGLLATINAQDLIVGGDMESADNWTVVDIAAGDGHTETFGYIDDSPSGGSGGCLSLAGNGNWSNAAVCQEIIVSRGSFYQISMVVKTSMDFEPDNQWVEIVVVPQMPAVDADITAYPNSLALNSWECKDVLFVDGNFADNNCDVKSPLNDIIHLEGEGDTTVVLVLKAGGGTAYNVLLDNVSVVEVSGTSVQSTLNSALNVFPNPVGNQLNISLDNTIQELKVVNILGHVVYSAENVGLKNIKVDFSAHAPGIYFVVVTDTNGNMGTIKTLKK